MKICLTVSEYFVLKHASPMGKYIDSCWHNNKNKQKSTLLLRATPQESPRKSSAE